MNRLYRSTTDRVFGGVCGGLATYLGTSSLFVRIVFMLIAMANGVGLALYLLLWLLVPSDTSPTAQQDQVWRDNVAEIKASARSLGQSAQSTVAGVTEKAGAGILTNQRLLVIGAGLVVIGLLALLDSLGLLWWFSPGKLLPLLLIGVGVVVLLNNLRDKH
jgi:phage shock protein C